MRLLLTTAEILISITALEFSYTQAPAKLKSFIMSLYMLSVAAGNYLTAGINHWIASGGVEAGRLEGPDYYAFFFKLITITTFAFFIVSRFYKEQQHLQTTASDP